MTMQPEINQQSLAKILEDVLLHARDVVFCWSKRDVSRHLACSGSIRDVLGFLPSEIASPGDFGDNVYYADKAKVQDALRDIQTGEEEPRLVEHRLITGSGDIRWVRTCVRQILPDWLGHELIVLTVTDIDEEKRYKNRLREKTYRDPLTGLPNRAMLEYKLQAFMESVQRNGKHLALIHLDLDNFKTFNEQYGYGFGDGILRQIGDVLLAELPVDTAVFRVGGDEFMLLIKNLDNRTDLEQIMQNIMNCLKSSIDEQGQQVTIQASAGIAIYPDDSDNTDDVQNNAMIALKKAKEHGTGHWCYFNPILKVDQIRRADLEKRLRRAIDQREFYLVYQPQLDTLTQQISGIEALIRWNDPEHGLVSPADFIPLAESCGLMIPIGAFVLETACLQQINWIAQGIPVVPIAVNISTDQIRDPHFFPNLRRTLAKTGLPPELLELEITESLFLESSDIVRELFAKIRSLGIRIALDDFGSGYSSLTYLKNFQLDRLKIDRTFIRDMKLESVETAITGTIVTLAHILELDVVAEGVETQEQYDYLKKVGCNNVQGYFFHRPLSEPKIQRLLKTQPLLEQTVRKRKKR